MSKTIITAEIFKMQVYLNVGNDGRIVIPKAIREQLGIEKNSKVMANIENGVMHISTIESSLAHAQALVKKHCKSDAVVVDNFINMRREDAAREEKEFIRIKKGRQ